MSSCCACKQLEVWPLSGLRGHPSHVGCPCGRSLAASLQCWHPWPPWLLLRLWSLDPGFCVVAESTFGQRPLALVGCPGHTCCVFPGLVAAPLINPDGTFVQLHWSFLLGIPSLEAGPLAGPLPPGNGLCSSPLLSNTMWRDSCTSSLGFLIAPHPQKAPGPRARGQTHTHPLDIKFSHQSAGPSWTDGGLVGGKVWRLLRNGL